MKLCDEVIILRGVCVCVCVRRGGWALGCNSPNYYIILCSIHSDIFVMVHNCIYDRCADSNDCHLYFLLAQAKPELTQFKCIQKVWQLLVQLSLKILTLLVELTPRGISDKPEVLFKQNCLHTLLFSPTIIQDKRLLYLAIVAFESGHIETADMLVAKGADVNKLDQASFIVTMLLPRNSCMYLVHM